MFKSTSGSNGANAGSGAPGKRGLFSVVGQDVTITGNVAAAADLHIDGTVEGDVTCGNLVLGAAGRIAGNVRAESARVAGAIVGPLAVRRLTVERGARITGDVDYETIAIDMGATIDGRLRHLSSDQPAVEAAPVTLVIASQTNG